MSDNILICYNENIKSLKTAQDIIYAEFNEFSKEFKKNIFIIIFEYLYTKEWYNFLSFNMSKHKLLIYNQIFIDDQVHTKQQPEHEYYTFMRILKYTIKDHEKFVNLFVYDYGKCLNEKFLYNILVNYKEYIDVETISRNIDNFGYEAVQLIYHNEEYLIDEVLYHKFIDYDLNRYKMHLLSDSMFRNFIHNDVLRAKIQALVNNYFE